MTDRPGQIYDLEGLVAAQFIILKRNYFQGNGQVDMGGCNSERQRRNSAPGLQKLPALSLGLKRTRDTDWVWRTNLLADSKTNFITKQKVHLEQLRKMKHIFHIGPARC